MDIGKVDQEHLPLSLHQDRIRILYTNARESMVLYGVWISLMLMMLLFNGANVVGALVWVIMLTIIQLFELKNVRSFFALQTIEDPFVWERYKVMVSFAQASVISSGAMLMLHLEQSVITYVLIVLIAIPAFVSSSTLATSVQSHYVWLLGMFVPLGVKAALAEDPVFWIFSGFIFLCAIPASALMGKQTSRSFIDTLYLRFENAELLKTVQAEKERSEKANRDKTRFLASASHDLRQPIHALELFSDALEHQLEKPAHLELMARIKESASAMNGLLYSLLDISKLDAGIVNVDKKAISLSALLLKVKQSLQHQADKKGIDLVLECPPCGVMSDAVLLESVLQNLLSNAIKYTDQGSVVISCKVSNGLVQLQVKDSGIGISAADFEHIYDEFFQINNPERDRKKGLGLGLSIVKRTCDLLGHGLSASSTVGVGSCFVLSLQWADAEVSPLDETAKPQPKQIDATVLVIDDEDTILEGMVNMLQPWGCHVLVAHNHDEALLHMQSEKVHIIIADYRLRDGELGTEVVKTLAADAGNIPAIIVTGDTGPEQLLDVKKAGFHVLHKPVAAVSMRALIRNCLKHAKKSA
ncbi:MAG: hypothetical protein AUK35_05455 [Zetaproteobacteria bacterium CG2_30_46_52]|nr:MAG: hypothetical protein AUK35_05455 [Zetaproteobacteria bacterium CG2_30_46_52]